MDVKEAVKRACDYLVGLNESVTLTELEEVEKTEDGGYWLITLSYLPRGQLPFSEKRKYKIFKVNAESGEVLSMKIRQTA